MPKMHGHSLANELLTHESRPLIVIHSSFDDPRLIRELMIRGVDDFVNKPTNYTAFAVKVRVLAERRQAPFFQLPLKLESSHISAAQCETRQSQHVIDVYLSSALPDTQIEHLIDYIQNDPQLAADVVRTANSSQLNSSGRNIANVREAVCRLGFRRVADLALNMLKPIEA